MPLGKTPQAKTNTAGFNLQGALSKSPSQKNMDLTNQSFENISHMPFDRMLEEERRYANRKENRSKSIIMQGQLDKKQRQQLEKKINKKLLKAEEEFDKAIKDKKARMSKLNERVD